MCGHACVHVCVYKISGLSIVLRIFAKATVHLLLIYPKFLIYFFRVELYFCFIFTQVIWRDEKCLIHVLNRGCRSTHKSGDTQCTLIGRRFIF